MRKQSRWLQQSSHLWPYSQLIWNRLGHLESAWDFRRTTGKLDALAPFEGAGVIGPHSTLSASGRGQGGSELPCRRRSGGIGGESWAHSAGRGRPGSDPLARAIGGVPCRVAER